MTRPRSPDGIIFEFQATPCRWGYEWREAQIWKASGVKGAYLLPKRGPISLEKRVPDEAAARAIPSNLHLVLATKVPLSKSGINAFADAWGDLGRDVADQVVEPNGPFRNLPFFATSYTRWLREIENLRQVWELWRIVKRIRDLKKATGEEVPAELDPFIKWEKVTQPITKRSANRVIYLPKPNSRASIDDPEVKAVVDHFARRVITDTPTRGRLTRRFEKGDLIGPANCFIMNEVNLGLAGKNLGRSGKVEHDVVRGGQPLGGVSLQLGWHDDRRLKPVLVPGCLRAALWLLLFQEITGNLNFVVCRGCELPFPVGGDLPGSRQIDAEFHSDECYRKWDKTESRRKKKERAKESSTS